MGEDLIRKNMPFNEMEEFYKRYYIASKNKETLKRFLKGVDTRSFPANTCYIPDINDMKYDSYTEQYIFKNAEKSNRNISIISHCRYTPAYFHSHTLFEIVYVLNGSCKNIVEDKILKMKTQDFCIIAPDTKHSLEVYSDDCLVINILIKKSTFDEAFYRILSKENILSKFFGQILYTGKKMDYILFHPAGDSKYQTVMEYLIEEYDTDDELSNMSTDNYLTNIFCILLRNHVENVEYASIHRKKTSAIADILGYIQNNYTNNTLKMTADHFNYSVPYLSKIIKEHTGMTYTDLVSEIRFKKACILLLNTDIPIRNIAEAVGYCNAEQFHKFFRKKGGKTPLSFRMGK